MAYMYTPPERLADGTIHILGIGASISATTLLILHANQAGSGLDVAAVSVYGAMATLLFTVSALYHMTPWDRVRPWLQRIDHAAIYLKIAGTYTPLAVMLNSVFAFVVLGLIWIVALIGAVGKLTEWIKPGLTSTWLYVAMGWASVVLIVPLVSLLPVTAIWMMILGGLLYTVGAFINHWESLRFNVAIWHTLVLVGSALFFSAIVMSLSVAPGVA